MEKKSNTVKYINIRIRTHTITLLDYCSFQLKLNEKRDALAHFSRGRIDRERRKQILFFISDTRT